MRGRLIAGLLWVALAGAAAARPGPPTEGTEPIPLSVWRFSDDGTAEHLQSGLRCPATLAGAQRAGVTTYDGFGLDVSCGYNTPYAAVTLYLTRPGDLQEAYAGAKVGLEQEHAAQHPRRVAETQTSMGGLTWLEADYSLDGGVPSDIWVADLHGWQLKFRTTYRPGAATAVREELEAITRQVRETAGARLALCAAAPVPLRDGRPDTAKGEAAASAGLMGALLGSVAQMAAGRRPDAGSPTIFCPEAPAAEGPMLSWRGVGADGTDAGVDRVTWMAVGEPPTLVVSRDDLGALVAGRASGGSAAPRWMATLTWDGTTSIYAYYAGRPSSALTTDLLSRIVAGKARPLSSFKADGKSVTISPG